MLLLIRALLFDPDLVLLKPRAQRFVIGTASRQCKMVDVTPRLGVLKRPTAPRIRRVYKDRLDDPSSSSTMTYCDMRWRTVQPRTPQ